MWKSPLIVCVLLGEGAPLLTPSQSHILSCSFVYVMCHSDQLFHLIVTFVWSCHVVRSIDPCPVPTFNVVVVHHSQSLALHTCTELLLSVHWNPTVKLSHDSRSIFHLTLPLVICHDTFLTFHSLLMLSIVVVIACVASSGESKSLCIVTSVPVQVLILSVTVAVSTVIVWFHSVSLSLIPVLYLHHVVTSINVLPPSVTSLCPVPNSLVRDGVGLSHWFQFVSVGCSVAVSVSVTVHSTSYRIVSSFCVSLSVSVSVVSSVVVSGCCSVSVSISVVSSVVVSVGCSVVVPISVVSVGCSVVVSFCVACSVAVSVSVVVSGCSSVAAIILKICGLSNLSNITFPMSFRYSVVSSLNHGNASNTSGSTLLSLNIHIVVFISSISAHISSINAWYHGFSSHNCQSYSWVLKFSNSSYFFVVFCILSERSSNIWLIWSSFSGLSCCLLWLSILSFCSNPSIFIWYYLKVFLDFILLISVLILYNFFLLFFLSL